MIRFVDEYFGSGIKNDIVLISAMSTRPNEWLAHTENYMILFRYKMGVLYMNMAETENDLYYTKGKIIAAQDSIAIAAKNYISFSEILTLLNWKCDDWCE
jgi:hypothetical protein